jgi:hypothetical protein
VTISRDDEFDHTFLSRLFRHHFDRGAAADLFVQTLRPRHEIRHTGKNVDENTALQVAAPVAEGEE